MTISHVWPGITPFTVWDLPWFLWVAYAKACDEYVAARKEESR